MNGSHEPLLVALSLGVATLAAYTALRLVGRVTAASGMERHLWGGGGSLAMGIGIWSMHFIGMLGFHLPVEMAYEPGRLALSIAVAVLASGLALSVASRQAIRLRTLLGAGACMAAAIAGMHYIGMAALIVPAQLTYDRALVAASIVVALVASIVGLSLARHFRDDERRGAVRWQRGGAALLIGLAIAGLHYTAMAAAHFGDPASALPTPDATVLPSTGLTVAVAATSTIILGLALLAAGVDRRAQARFIAAIQDREQAYRALSSRYEALVDSIPGIVWEADAATFRFTFVSRQAERLLGHPIERWLRDPGFWAQHIYPEDRAAAVAYCRKATADAQPHELEYRMLTADGRVVWLHDVVTVVTPSGGPPTLRGVMVDITAAKAAEAEVRQLGGLIPICASCKNVRDDEGYWQQVEVYVRERSEAEFSHALCPSCATRLYPDHVRE